jgi:hypothetical protein
MHGIDCWCIVADADEFACLPRAMNFKECRNHLIRQNAQLLYGILLDMFSKNDILDAGYAQGDDPSLSCPYFDPDMWVYDTSGIRYTPATWNHVAHGITGGTRFRAFELFVCLRKIMLFRYQPGICMAAGMHSFEIESSTPLAYTVSPSRGTVLHFKYLQSFTAYAKAEAHREAHYDNAAEYKTYAALNVINLWHEGAKRIENMQDYKALEQYSLSLYYFFLLEGGMVDMVVFAACAAMAAFR